MAGKSRQFRQLYHGYSTKTRGLFSCWTAFRKSRNYASSGSASAKVAESSCSILSLCLDPNLTTMMPPKTPASMYPTSGEFFWKSNLMAIPEQYSSPRTPKITPNPMQAYVTCLMPSRNHSLQENLSSSSVVIYECRPHGWA